MVISGYHVWCVVLHSAAATRMPDMSRAADVTDAGPRVPKNESAGIGIDQKKMCSYRLEDGVVT
jgi:hypothetical protein